MEVTSDFRRYYQLTVPTDTRHIPGTVLFRLSQGVAQINGSLLRERLLEKAPAAPEASKPTMGWHGWDEKTMLLLNLNNLLSAFLGVKTISPPGGKQESSAALEKAPEHESAQHMFERLSRLFKGSIA